MLKLTLLLTTTTALAQAQPDDDGTVEGISKDGFRTVKLPSTCVSRGQDGSIIDGELLPVGGDRWLECTVNGATLATFEFTDFSNRRFCALGEAISLDPKAASDLSVGILGRYSNGDLVLWATSATGEQIDVHQIDCFGAKCWPVYLEGPFRTIDIRQVNDGTACDALYGI